MKLEKRSTPGATSRSPQSRLEKGSAARRRDSPLTSVPICEEAMAPSGVYSASRISEAAWSSAASLSCSSLKTRSNASVTGVQTLSMSGCVGMGTP